MTLIWCFCVLKSKLVKKNDLLGIYRLRWTSMTMSRKEMDERFLLGDSLPKSRGPLSGETSTEVTRFYTQMFSKTIVRGLQGSCPF